jgi:quercetin dioxygenase-like cupin family protein
MRRQVGWALACAFVFCLACGTPAQSQSDGARASIVKPEDIAWKSPLGMGVSIVTLHGDSTQPGLFVQRVKFPPNVFDRPHYHSGDRHVTVIQGTLYQGSGTDWNPDKAIALRPGSYVFQPAKSVHWDGAKNEEVIIEVVGYGPGGSTLVDKGQPFLVRAKE